MKKIIFLLLMPFITMAQIPAPKSTTTFSNIVATGSETVTGNLKVGGAITSPTVYGSSAASGTLNLFGTSSATAGVVNIGMSTGTTNINSITDLNNKLRVGSSSMPSATLDVTGNMAVSSNATITGALNTATINNPTGTLYLGAYGNSQIWTTGGTVFFNPVALISSSSTHFNFTTPNSYSLTASTNIPAFKVTGATRGFLSGAKALQYESYLTAPTYTANASTTITTASGLHVEKPIMSTNVTATNIYGISTDGNLLLGSAGLTGGNTGTVAVLSDAVFSMQMIHNITGTLTASSTFYFGNVPYSLSPVSTIGNIRVPYNCTLVGYTFNNVYSGLSSSETVTLSIRKNNTTDYVLNTSITYSVAGSVNTFTASGLSQDYAAGDLLNAKLSTPAFITPPTTCLGGLTLWFVRRQ